MITETCVFQMMARSNGVRSDPFAMSSSKLADHLKKMDLAAVGDDYVLVLMEIGVIPEGPIDYTTLSKGSAFSRRAVLTVNKFIETFGG